MAGRGIRAGERRQAAAIRRQAQVTQVPRQALTAGRQASRETAGPYGIQCTQKSGRTAQAGRRRTQNGSGTQAGGNLRVCQTQKWQRNPGGRRRQVCRAACRDGRRNGGAGAGGRQAVAETQNGRQTQTAGVLPGWHPPGRHPGRPTQVQQAPRQAGGSERQAGPERSRESQKETQAGVPLQAGRTRCSSRQRWQAAGRKFQHLQAVTVICNPGRQAAGGTQEFTQNGNGRQHPERCSNEARRQAGTKAHCGRRQKRHLVIPAGGRYGRRNAENPETQVRHPGRRAGRRRNANPER